jgi:ABC-type polysaccharide/polyol phosphate transport system ATPase subunit
MSSKQISSPEDLAIQCHEVSKFYPVFRRPWDGIRFLGHSVTGTIEKALSKMTAVKALDGLSFSVAKGERVGIIGRNGAGKSTLLKLLAGSFLPTKGELQVNGKIYSLMPGSVGFDAELSTLENARNYLLHYGLSGSRLSDLVEEIERFVELGEYFYQPLKNYSQGMRVRAEFATATAVYSDIITIDEVLGAGDIYWAEKCARRMDHMCGQGSALLLVSHSVGQILRYCDRVIWIEKGKVVMDGPALEVTKRYEGFLERLSWHTDDSDDKSVQLEKVVPQLGNVTLPENGLEVVRWPGLGDVVFTGFWLNDTANTFLSLPRDRNMGIRIGLEAQKTGTYSLRYLLTFWSREGKRMAVFENEGDDISLMRGESHTVRGNIPGGQLPIGEYFLALSLFDIKPLNSSVNEQVARHDMLYKFFRLVVTETKQDRWQGRVSTFGHSLDWEILVEEQ